MIVSGNSITINQTGFYLISAQGYVDAINATGSGATIQIDVNDASADSIIVVERQKAGYIYSQRLMKLNSGDIVKFKFQWTNMGCSASYFYFFFQKIGYAE